jgi:ElaB/YqjD/DUF883 family membrane-anchored ribosome-binding protein
MDEKQSNLASAGVSTATPAAQPEPGPEAVGGQPRINGSATSANSKAAPADSPAPGSQTHTARQGDRLTTVLEASRAELDKLLVETQTIHERSWQVIHQLLEDSQLRASQAVDECLARFETEIQDRIRNEMAMTLENFDVEAGARLTARFDQALAAAKQRQHSIEQDLAVAVAENRKQLDQISTIAADGLRQREQSLLGDLQKESQKYLAALTENAGQLSNNLQRLGDNLSDLLSRSTEEAVQVFQSRIEQVWEQALARAEKRIGEAASSKTAELAKEARQLVDQEMSEFLSNALRRFNRSSDEQSSGRSN